MHIKITITEKMIQDFWIARTTQNFDDCANCPVAKALQESLGDPKIRVNGFQAGLKGDYFNKIELPFEVSALITKIDCSVMPPNLPITFEFDAEITKRIIN